MIIKNKKISLLIASLVLCVVVLVIDLLGVKVVEHNGLGFKAHCYSYGSTFIVASAVFTWIYWVSSEKNNLKYQAIQGLILGSLWWIISFFALLYFHGAIGGTM